MLETISHPMRNHGIVWCQHCGSPHLLGTTVCPRSARTMERSIHRVRSQARLRAHPLIGATLAGRYRVTGFIGSGGMGDVLAAENHLRRAVAIKVLHAEATVEAAARLEHEAALISAIQHPNICDVHDVGRLPDGSPFIVLERLSGESLADLVRRMPRLDVAFVSDVFMQILSGLQAAHGAHIVHRDLKPHNVYLVDRLGCAPLVKIVDFGLAKDVSGMRLRSLTRPGEALGTLQYMAPEQLRGQNVDHRADIYAVGLMLHQCLAGRHPFQGETLADTHANVLRSTATPLRVHRPDVSPALERVVLRALARDPGSRWPSANAFQAELYAAMRSRATYDGRGYFPSSM